MNIAHICGAATLGTLLWFFWVSYRISTPSRGLPITDRGKRALLLVDLQTVFWNEGPYSEKSKARVLNAIRSEIELAKKEERTVIAVRQEWSSPSTKVIARLFMKGQALSGSKGTELAAPFVDLADHELIKGVQDAFENGQLDRLLEELDVGDLRIMGLDFNYCVQKTALAAVNRGFKVVVVEDASLSSASTARARAKMMASGIVVA